MNPTNPVPGSDPAATPQPEPQAQPGPTSSASEATAPANQSAASPAPSIYPTANPVHVPGSLAGVQQPAPGKPGLSRGRKLVWAGLGAVVIAGLAGGYVFGLYLPNKPENVWNTAFTRTGQALGSMVETAANDDSKAYQKLQLDGSLDATVGTDKYKGTINGQFDTATVNGAATVEYTDQDGAQHKLGLDVRSHLPDGKTYPDSYLRISGIQALGIDYFLPGAGSYDNKWIYIGGDYLKTLIPDAQQQSASSNESQVSRDDAIELARIVKDKTNEYIFTTDATKAVVKNDQFVGKEESEGVSAFHFKASVDKDHAIAYCNALSSAVIDSKAYKKLASDDDTSKAKANAKQSCDDSLKEIKGRSFDLWVDKAFKLVQKIRVTDPEDTTAYYELGQTYNGGNVIPQFARFHSDKDKFDFNETATLDTGTKAIGVKLTAKGGKTAEDMTDLTMSLNMAPLKDDVPFDKPAGSIPLPDVFKQLGIDPSEFTTPITSLSDDSSSI